MNMGVLQYYFSMKALLWVLVVFVQTREYMGCLEEERAGLLHLKSFLIISIPSLGAYNSAYDYLPSWVDHEKNDCCDWERVTCNSTTGHLIELSLDNLMQDPNYNYDDDYYYYKMEKYDEKRSWLLNVSLLEPFKELRSLDLSLNAIHGCIPDEGFEKLSTLRNLEILNLGQNSFDDNSILQSLGAITSLKTLNLTGNYLEGYFPAQELVTLRNLNALDISSNGYNGSLPNQGFERLAVLRNLETLILDRNLFGYSIIPSLSNLTSLMTLSLSGNSFWADGGVNVEGGTFERLSVLRNLKTLNLDGNGFNDSIIPSLSGLTSLTSLSLAFNRIQGGGEGWKMLSRLENLEILDLSYNGLNDTSFLQSIAAVKSLKSLNLANNELTGYFPTKEVANLTNLEVLILQGNHFGGRLAIQEFCTLKKLEVLDLSDNYFEGILPPCLNNMTSLVVLDISDNQFNGNASSSYVEASGTSLEYIDFSYNQFVGIFSFNLFANYSKLEVLRFNSQNNKVEIETEGSMGWSPLFQLKIIELSNCNLNKLTDSIPKFLLVQHELDVVDLSHSKLNGSFPNWLVENNTRLHVLDLRNNSFMGQLYIPSLIHTHINWMDVSTNHLEGKLQENIGMTFPNLVYLNLSNNNLEGNLPSSISGMLYLEVLDLSFNHFSGGVPRGLNTDCLSLEFLNFAYNSFNGAIFIGTNKRFLQMNNNQFTSITLVPNSTVGSLFYLDISNNKISGTIPRWLGNTSNVMALVMANNDFYGRIPCELSITGTLDLSHNLFKGSLSFCLNLPNLEHLYLQGNKFTGSIPKVLFNSSSLLTLDIRDNKFTGSISIEIKELQRLQVLLLSGNHFTGIIPNQLCLLKMINIMDLSKNAFFGTIPQCLYKIYFGNLRAANFSYSREESSLFGSIISLTYTYKGFSRKFPDSIYDSEYFDAEVQIEFVTKYRHNSYKGSPLGYMSGLDFSCNNLTGGIPPALGQISSLRALNLSYNHLTGKIPTTFSELALLESLDLSHNSLSGEIPSALIDLTFLEVFNVANNNLSGKVPDMKAQFGTFEKSSYEGNLFLCGPPLDKSCAKVKESDPTPTQSSNESDEKWYEVDPLVFHTSFSVSYIIFFFSVISLLYINPYWLQRCSNLMEDLIYSCYYFAFDTSKRLSNCVCN
ncbi:receptor-like protein 56 isoform X1 [Juglans regia]|uniref:Receptor-like protein 56 isoform X1 n=1 Tax=Juglans regia TaxID=51240 RepID=A0A6P9EJM5_JUGRE|nr:receptor-like protein 56 isoform X1 [Juglans regia]